jgi:hypothetical protein
VPVARRLVGVVSHVRGLQKFKIQSEAEKQYYENTTFAGFSGSRRVLMLRPTPAGGARERREVRSTHASGPRACTRGATARAGAGGSQEGARRAATGTPGVEERVVPAARAVGTLLARDGGVLVIRRGRGGRGGRGGRS